MRTERLDVHLAHFLFRNGSPGWVLSGVERGTDLESGLGRGVGDEADHDLGELRTVTFWTLSVRF